MTASIRQIKWSRLVACAGLSASGGESADPSITAIVDDSRQAGPGACFVATRGTQVDGHVFIEQALQAGVSAVICERPVAVPKGVACLVLPCTRGVAARLAATFHGLDRLQNEGRFHLVGITGTNGKSTFCYLLKSILEAARHRTALLGTIAYDLVGRTIEASMTTPPPVTLMGYLAEAANAGATYAVMEVSSHALDQGRCDGLRFDVGVFSNLTGDHLDYHVDMDNYLRAKKKLFDGLDERATAAINMDDPAGIRMVADCRARVLRYGILDADCPDDRGLDIYAVLRDIQAEGSLFDLVLSGVVEPNGSGERRCQVRTAMVGRHNVQNCLAAAAAAVALGIDLESIARGLAAIRGVPGRMQRVRPLAADGTENDTGYTVLVDYAHTDDALQNVLRALRPLARGRLLVLFGCGGDRDRTKRSRMARVAAEGADLVMVTSDNPRSEDPARIIEDILTGFTDSQRTKVRIEADRRRAIHEVIGLAEPGDIVLLAGKGHENYQIIGRDKLPFDDAAVAVEAMSKRNGCVCSS
ncbi:MAG: UDP-N-acetylmuramoyl-L-alanyl-D-glutamate--2,6-diaminopimelate ligase [Phycisphaerales bacterium]|nr:UDP-N-acetylmuramoyl-L-alanyl-D-glutamate--2,6-diaminopimelate ligase [Phycisphaerales bacterium]